MGLTGDAGASAPASTINPGASAPASTIDPGAPAPASTINPGAPAPAFPITLHDTARRGRVTFTPIDPAHVRVYMCGPTVYDVAHIGNMRAFTVADVLVRLLRASYRRVTYVRNITDVDDKITARAAAEGVGIDTVTERTIAALHADLAAVGNAPPDIEPRVTAHIAPIVTLIERLLDQRVAYAADGHVLFAVDAFPGYGALSGRSPADLLAGARVEVAPYKRAPGDFVLWKPSGSDQPGWDSPWGRGRPGWHIECSAMCRAHLGDSFDLHLGGEDLIFPHHENERAQSLAAGGAGEFARHWLHNAMLQVNGRKMSKSLGNFVTVRAALLDAPGEALRLALLRAHYRSVLAYSADALADAKRELDRWYRALARVEGDRALARVEAPDAQASTSPARLVAEAMADDLNTPEAIAALHRHADRALAGDADAGERLRAGGALLGLLGRAPADWFRGDGGGGGGARDDAAAIERAIGDRLAARRARDWARADAIRDRLAADGVILEDGSGGTTWRRG